MPSTNEIYKAIQTGLERVLDNDAEIGQSQQAMYVRFGEQVFAIKVENIAQFDTAFNGAAAKFMQTLDYPPEKR